MGPEPSLMMVLVTPMMIDCRKDGEMEEIGVVMVRGSAKSEPGWTLGPF